MTKSSKTSTSKTANQSHMCWDHCLACNISQRRFWVSSKEQFEKERIENLSDKPKCINCDRNDKLASYTEMDYIEVEEIPQNVYPDHPLIVALHVFANFKNASEAIAECAIDECPALVSSSKVPASGDGAWACYRMIKHIKEKHLTPETACLWADGFWVRLVGPGTGNFEDRLKDGLEVAYKARAIFIEAAKKWEWS